VRKVTDGATVAEVGSSLGEYTVPTSFTPVIALFKLGTMFTMSSAWLPAPAFAVPTPLKVTAVVSAVAPAGVVRSGAQLGKLLIREVFAPPKGQTWAFVL
jgi:hypothetical protein